MADENKVLDQKVKNWLESKTIWGLLILFTPAISGLLGFDVATEVGQSWEILIETLGLLIGLYGRWKANAAIATTKWSKKTPAS